MQENTQVTQDPAPEATLSQEQQLESLKKLTKQRAKIMSQLVRVHTAELLHTLAFSPKMKGNEKADLIVKFCDMMEGVLDFGVDITGMQVPERGAIGKKTATLGGILCQALDNKMVMLAQNLDEADKNNSAPVSTELSSVNSPLVRNLEEAQAKLDSGEITTAQEYLNTLNKETGV